MVFLVAALGLLLHIGFWGAGAAIWLTPRPWRNHWPVFCLPMGLALQSAVVWAGAYADLQGANAYARGSEILPLVLLIAAIGRHGLGFIAHTMAQYRGVGIVVIAVLGLLVWPMSAVMHALTTSSLGSCDAADYAAGARVLQEFARTDRTGFLGLTEVVRVASVDNFFDFWLRLNHFTPSALIAFNGAALGYQPHEITGVVTAIVLAASVPVVYWLARGVLRFRAGSSLWLAAIYGLSPITWYAVAQVAIGQLLAAQAIALITWAGVALWHGRLSGKAAWAMSGVLAMAYWLVMGSYNFIVIVCLAPAVAYVGISVLRQRDWFRFLRWLAAVLAPLVVVGALFTQRTLGLIERFQLFGQFDFGWKIPVITPEGWLGTVNAPGLQPVAMGVRVGLWLLLAALMWIAIRRDHRAGRRGAWQAGALVFPAIVGYAFLEVRGVIAKTNASYDAYKLSAVFFPILLGGFSYWVTLTGSRQRSMRYLALGAIAAMSVANGWSACRFSGAMKRPPLTVDADLVRLQAIEAHPEVTSINMDIADFWTRLWANAFLLRKPQYFATHTYEGRLNTALKGDWSLTDDIASVTMGQGDALRIGQSFTIANLRSPAYLRFRVGSGWYDEEHIARAREHWRWTAGDATFTVENPHDTPRTVSLRLHARSLEPRDVQVWLADKPVGQGRLAESLGEQVFSGIVVPPGVSVLSLRSSKPPTPGSARDARSLSFAVYGAELQVAGAR